MWCSYGPAPLPPLPPHARAGDARRASSGSQGGPRRTAPRDGAASGAEVWYQTVCSDGRECFRGRPYSSPAASPSRKRGRAVKCAAAAGGTGGKEFFTISTGLQVEAGGRPGEWTDPPAGIAHRSRTESGGWCSPSSTHGPVDFFKLLS